MKRSRSLAILGAAIAAYCLAAALAWASAGPFAAVRRDGPADFETLASAAAAAGAWLCLAWLTTGSAVAAVGTLPNATGRHCARLSRRMTPAAVRRLAEIALGVTVASGAGLAGTVPAMAAGPQTVPGAARVHGIVPGATAAAVDGPVEGRDPRPAYGDLPSLDRPAATALPAPIEAPTPAWPPAPVMSGYAPLPTRSAPHAEQTVPAPTHLVTSAPRTGQAEEQRDVVVRRGDSLWAITARHLGPGASDAEIAATWPRWYAANRNVIGADPDLLLPGQRLRPPAPHTCASPKEGR